MESRAKLFGHPIHQMLIVFPLGLLGMSIVFDLIHLATDEARWAHASYLMIGAGILSGLFVAAFGLTDWLGIPSGTRAKSVGLLHAIGNVIVLGLFAASWWLRRDLPEQPTTNAMLLQQLLPGSVASS